MLPAMTTLPAASAPTPGDAPLDYDAACISCQYNLRGLRPTGACPECGAPIYDSVHSFFLRYADPTYVATILKGLTLVLNGILIYIVAFVAMIALSMVFSGGVTAMQVGTRFVTLCISLMILLGYWKYTAPDPTVVGLENPTGARAVCRTATAVYAGVSVISFLAVLAGAAKAFDLSGSAPGAASVFVLAMLAFGLLGFLAWLAQVLASLKYTAWVAARVPDPKLQAKAKRYMWLLPLIAILGAIILYLGPIIALVMYWNMLDKLRKQIKLIQLVPPAFPKPAPLGP
jgi:hypothetical protein